MVNLEDIILSEISQTNRQICMIPLIYEVPRVVRFIKTESRIMVSRGWGEEE